MSLLPSHPMAILTQNCLKVRVFSNKQFEYKQEWNYKNFRTRFLSVIIGIRNQLQFKTNSQFSKQKNQSAHISNTQREQLSKYFSYCSIYLILNNWIFHQNKIDRTQINQIFFTISQMSHSSKSRKQIVKHKGMCDKKNLGIMETGIIIRSKWTPEEDRKLIANMSLFGHRWLMVAQKMEERNASQCCQRWKRLQQHKGIRQNKGKRWTQTEDQALLRIFKQIGPYWNAIAKQIQNKTGKQVRRRYKNFLDPNLNHGPMTDQEDEKIFQEYLKQGTQWSKISVSMPGRSENMVKNRFYSYIKQKYLKQPNLYFRIKPLDQDERPQYSSDNDLSQGSQIQPNQQEQNENDLYNDSNELIGNNLSSYYWSIETRCPLLTNI
ncbi:unnamed protein product (macronuclear) [Paramecium tetraurelia]|uniref:Uncharacterized protein n=1 Tax=Paramecium tetraurelia TaxID=5888 RepID=A0CCY5_PARTE|nr:uncharacterized protein GSPATT00037437001 [Paramecium tetraurelia]CAK68652.1 unnamed protein product [Paramecium tetraurelia]|eukprot:XP_001436049.1 hypothetical protein (macronuclear) [Paramecium tetraurelia strain d4-2]